MDVSRAIDALDKGNGAAALDVLLALWRAERARDLEDAIAALGERIGDPMTLALGAVFTTGRDWRAAQVRQAEAAERERQQGLLADGARDVR